MFVFVCVCVCFLWAKSELHGWPSAEQRLWVGSGAQTADNGIWLPLTTAGPCPGPPIFKFPLFIWKEKYHQSTYNLYDLHWPPLGPVLVHQYLSFRFSFEKYHQSTYNLYDLHWPPLGPGPPIFKFLLFNYFPFFCQQGIMWNVQALPKAKQTQEFPSCNNSTAFKTGQTFGQDLKYLLLPKTEHGNEETHFSIMKWSFVADIPE